MFFGLHSYQHMLGAIYIYIYIPLHLFKGLPIGQGTDPATPVGQRQARAADRAADRAAAAPAPQAPMPRKVENTRRINRICILSR